MMWSRAMKREAGGGPLYGGGGFGGATPGGGQNVNWGSDVRAVRLVPPLVVAWLRTRLTALRHSRAN
jgi:hypothetical protein